MTISEEQRLARMSVIGASDVGKIMGASRFGGPKDVWVSKVFMTEDKRTSRAAHRGNLLEDPVLRWAERFESVVPENCIMSDNIRYARKSAMRTPFASNCDAVVWSGDMDMVTRWTEDRQPREINEVPVSVVEAKTSRYPEEWGPTMSDQIPDTYLFQVQTQMWCSGATIGWVPVLLGDLEFRMYKVRYSKELMDIVIGECDRLWWHVENKVEPDGGPPPSLDTVREIVREEEKVIELPADFEAEIYEWRRLVNEKNRLIKEERSKKAELIMALRDCEIGVVPSGHLSYTADSRGARTLRWNEDADARAAEDED